MLLTPQSSPSSNKEVASKRNILSAVETMDDVDFNDPVQGLLPTCCSGKTVMSHGEVRSHEKRPAVSTTAVIVEESCRRHNHMMMHRSISEESDEVHWILNLFDPRVTKI